jgi:hypothetical protein
MADPPTRVAQGQEAAQIVEFLQVALQFGPHRSTAHINAHKSGLLSV